MRELYLDFEQQILAITGTTYSPPDTFVTGPIFLTTQVWNNQLDYQQDSNDYTFQTPAAFIELGTEGFAQLGQRYQGIDMVVRFHIIQDYYNGTNMSENLTIFALRDFLVKNFSIYQPPQGGFMVKTNEYQDYNHNNLYHYVVEYSFHWVDDSAVPQPIYAPTPITLIIDKNIE